MYAVIGANGFVGSYVVKNIMERTDERILAVGHDITERDTGRFCAKKCDIQEPESVKQIADILKDEKDVKAVYLAAYHHPDEVKRNPRLAWNINITSLSYFLNAMPRFKCFFYISTEMVYGECGLDYRFKEDDRLKPVNIYGHQKAVAESLTLGYGYNVVRFPFMIGKSLLPGRKHFYDEIVETVREGKCIEMFADAYKTALDFDTAAGLLVSLTEVYTEDMPKILNIAGDDVLSKYDIGLRIILENGMDPNQVVPIYLRDDNKIFNEIRADCTLLDNSLLKETLNLREIKMRFR